MGTTLYWDIIDRCNGRCAYCAVAASMKGPSRPPLPAERLCAAVERFAAEGVSGLVLLGGEPTLHPALPELVDHACGCGLRVGIATNALSLSAPLRERLLNHPGLSINVSLDSLSEEENDAVRGSGYHRSCLRHLKALLEERRRLGSRAAVTVQVTLTRINLARLRQTLAGLLDLGVDRVLLDRMRPEAFHPRAVRDLAPNARERIRGARTLARAAREWGQGQRLLLNYGHAMLRAHLHARFGYGTGPQTWCEAGWGVAVADFEGCLHPCRAAASLPVPEKTAGVPWYRKSRLRIGTAAAERFLDHPYFVQFFNFAHSAAVYRQIERCRACEHFEVCEPCPLDVALFGDNAVIECRTLEEGCDE
jgi:MoaA/NifB/PqqE/SkfB family radical SAM enzyme